MKFQPLDNNIKLTQYDFCSTRPMSKYWYSKFRHWVTIDRVNYLSVHAPHQHTSPGWDPHPIKNTDDYVFYLKKYHGSVLKLKK